MRSSRLTKLFIAALAAFLAVVLVSGAADLVTFEAESGTLGADISVNNGSPTYVTTLSDSAGNSPASAARVASYTVTFPSAGTYKLYARVRVGPGGANDDSFFYGNGFEAKSTTADADWILVNSVNVGGFVNSSDLVSGSGSAGVSVWKWINLSDYTGAAGEPPISFAVAAGSLTQTFQIGARENGFDLDRFAFGTSGTSFAVSNLDLGTVPTSTTITNVFPGPDGMALHRFSPLNGDINADGANPAAGLALCGGVLCGTALNGGSQGAGTAFYMTPDGSNFNTFHSFANVPYAGNPRGELAVLGTRFFSTAFGGGSAGAGAILAGETNGGVSLLRSFAAVNAHTATNSGGASPTALLAFSGGTLYGTANAGGASANGTIFSLTTNGGSFSVLHDFSLLESQTGTNADGAAPWGGLILADNKLYGTASAGGAGGGGVVFSIGTNGADFTALHSFSPLDTITTTNADGAIPYGGLVISGGTLYGTTFAGGQGGRGTVFSLLTNGTGFAVLHHFTPTHAVTRTNTDGALPCAALILSSNVLYGTASAGGAGAAGTVFSVNLNDAQFTALHSFSALANNGTNADGAFPIAPVLRWGSSLYGTTFSGGPGAAGTVFSIPLPTSPAIITNVVLNPGGNVTLYFLGTPHSTNVIQASTSLSPLIVWQNVSTNIADANGAWQFTDSNNNATRFYRSHAR